MSEQLKIDIIDEFVFKKEQQENLGNNEKAIAVIIRFLSSLDLNDKYISSFVNNFSQLKVKRNNFQIFQSENKNSFYMHTFKVLNINKDDDNYVLGHEIGHAILNILDDTKMPDNFPLIVNNAKKNILSSDHLDFEFDNKLFINARFRTILEYIEGKTNDDIKGLGPFSDMISSTFQNAGFENVGGRKVLLPYNHKNEYYMKDNNINYNLVYDEQFANFFTLYMNGNKDKLNVLKLYLGNEWFEFMNNKLHEVIDKLSNVKINEEEKGATK